MYLNLGINAGRMGDQKTMNTYFQQAVYYAEKLGEEYKEWKINVISRVNALRNSFDVLSDGTEKQLENERRANLTQLDILLKRALGNKCSNEEIS